MKLVFIEIALLAGAVQAQSDWNIADQIQQNMTNEHVDDPNRISYTRDGHRIKNDSERSNQIFYEHHNPVVHQRYLQEHSQAHPQDQPLQSDRESDPYWVQERQHRQLYREQFAFDTVHDPHMRHNHRRNDIVANSDEEPNYLPDAGQMFSPPSIKEQPSAQPTPVFPSRAERPKSPKKKPQSPPKQKAKSPPKQKRQSPPKQRPASPAKKKPASPPKQRPASPPKQRPQSPPKQRPQSPPKQRPASPPKQRPQSPKKRPQSPEKRPQSPKKDRGSTAQQKEFLGGTRDQPVFIPQGYAAPSQPVFAPSGRPVNPDTEYQPKGASRPLTQPVRPAPVYQAPTPAPSPVPVQTPRPFYTHPAPSRSSQPQIQQQSRPGPVFAPAFGQQRPAETQPSRPQPVRQPIQPMSRGLQPTTKAISPRKLSPTMTPPPQAPQTQDPAYREVLGRKKPDYRPVEPFVQQDLTQPVAPRPVPKDVRASVAEQKQTTGTTSVQPRQQPQKTVVQPAEVPYGMPVEEQLAKSGQAAPERVPRSLMPIYDEYEQGGRHDYYGGSAYGHHPRYPYGHWPYGAGQTYDAEYGYGQHVPPMYPSQMAPTWTDRQHAYAQQHPIKSFDAQRPPISPYDHGMHGLGEKPLWGRDFKAPVQFDFLHGGPPPMGDPSITGHRDEPITDAERRAGQRYQALSPGYGGGYLGLPQTATQPHQGAPMAPKEDHLITPGYPSQPIPGMGRSEFEFQHGAASPFYDYKQARREQKMMRKMGKHYSTGHPMYFNNEGNMENDWESYDAYMKDSFGFEEDSEDSLAGNFEAGFLGVAAGMNEDGVDELDFNGLHTNDMYDQDTPVYGQHRRRAPEQTQLVKTQDPWGSHPTHSTTAGTYPYGATRPTVGGDYAVLDWGAHGTSGSPQYGTRDSRQYGPRDSRHYGPIDSRQTDTRGQYGTIPPYETKMEKKVRRTREKQEREQQKQAQKMREEQVKVELKEQERQQKESLQQAKYEMDYKLNPQKAEKERAKREQKEAKQKFKLQQQQQQQQFDQQQQYQGYQDQGQGQRQPQTKLEKERQKQQSKEIKRRIKYGEPTGIQQPSLGGGDQWQIDWQSARNDAMTNPFYGEPQHTYSHHDTPTYEYEWDHHYYPDYHVQQQFYSPFGGHPYHEEHVPLEPDNFYNRHYDQHDAEEPHHEEIIPQVHHKDSYYDTPDFAFAPFTHHEPGYGDEFWFSDYHPSIGSLESLTEEHMAGHPLEHPHKGGQEHVPQVHHDTQPHLRDVHEHGALREHLEEHKAQPHGTTKQAEHPQQPYHESEHLAPASPHQGYAHPDPHALSEFAHQLKQVEEQHHHEAPRVKEHEWDQHTHYEHGSDVDYDHEERHHEYMPSYYDQPHPYQSAEHHEVEHPFDAPAYAYHHYEADHHHGHEIGHPLEHHHKAVPVYDHHEDHYYEQDYGHHQPEHGHGEQHTFHHEAPQHAEQPHHQEAPHHEQPRHQETQEHLEHHHVEQHHEEQHHEEPHHEEYYEAHYQPHLQHFEPSHQDRHWQEPEHELLYWPGQQDDRHHLERPHQEQHASYHDEHGTKHDLDHTHHEEPHHQDYATRHYEHGHEDVQFAYDHFDWQHDAGVDVAGHHPGELPFAHDHERMEGTAHHAMPDFEFKPMMHQSSHHPHHHHSEEEMNWLQDPYYHEETHDPYGLKDYTYDQIYHDYDFHIEQDPHDEEMYHISYPSPSHSRHHRLNGISDFMLSNGSPSHMDLLEMAEYEKNETPVLVRHHFDDPVFLEPDYSPDLHDIHSVHAAVHDAHHPRPHVELAEEHEHVEHQEYEEMDYHHSAFLL